jgi:hypothetical protein
MVTMMWVATALSEPALAKAQDGGGIIPHNRLAQNVTTASTPGVTAEAAATQGTAASELVRVLPAAVGRTAALPAAVGRTAALPAAVGACERLPALTKRRAVTRAGEQGGSENLNGERS